MRVIIISAVAKNGVIGRSNGQIPWHVKEEFQHFKNTTLGFPVIMGRKTFETLKEPLRGRPNFIVSRNKGLNYSFEDVKIFNSLSDAVGYCREQKYRKVFIIGGANVYKQSFEIADEMIISYMKFNSEGDVFFPEFNMNDWVINSEEEKAEFKIIRYVKR